MLLSEWPYKERYKLIGVKIKPINGEFKKDTTITKIVDSAIVKIQKFACIDSDGIYINLSKNCYIVVLEIEGLEI